MSIPPQSKIRDGHPIGRAGNPASLPRGFTLIEILIVVAIIGILAAMLTGVASSMVAKANSASCISRMRQIGMGVQAYLGENNNTFFPSAPAGSSSNWIRSIFYETGGQSNLFRCPADRSAPNVERTYRFNNTAGSSGPSAGATLFGKNISKVVKPSTKIMVFCIGYKGTAAMPIFKNDTVTWTYANDNDTNTYTTFPRLHQTNGVNVLFVDGHAESLQYPIVDSAYYWDR